MNLDLFAFYSRNNLPKIEDGVYVIHFDEYESIGSRQIALYVNGDNMGAYNDATYFDNVAVEHIPEEIEAFTSNRNIATYFQSTRIRFSNVRILLYWTD